MSTPVKVSISEQLEMCSIHQTNILKNSEGVVQFIGHLDADVKIPYIAVEEDTGPLVKALVQESAGKNLIAYREWLTPRELASAFTKATGMNAEVVTLPKGSFPPSVTPSLKISIEDNMAYWNEFGYEGREDPTVVHPRDVSQPGLVASQAAAHIRL
jgi:hypothetical protein